MMMIFGVGYQEAEGVHLRLRSYSSVFLTRRWRVKSWCWQWSGPRGQPSATKTTKSHLPFTPPSSPPAMSSPLQVPRPSPTMRFLTHPMVIKKRKTPFFPPLFFYFFFSFNSFLLVFFDVCWCTAFCMQTRYPLIIGTSWTMSTRSFTRIQKRVRRKCLSSASWWTTNCSFMLLLKDLRSLWALRLSNWFFSLFFWLKI